MEKLLLVVLCSIFITSCAVINNSKSTTLKINEPVSLYNLNLPMDSIISLDINPNKKYDLSLKYIETDIDSNSLIRLVATIEVKDFQNSNTFYAYPSLFLEDTLVYLFPDTIENSSIQISMKMEFLDKIFNRIDNLEYQEFKLKKGDTFSFNGYSINLVSLNRNPNYKSEKDDIAISAKLDIYNDTDPILLTTAEPIYFIREMNQYSIRDNVDETELSIEFLKIDPENEIFTFKIANYKKVDSYPLEVQIIEN